MSALSVASQIATTTGAVVAAGSLLSGFVIYRKAKIDEYATQFRVDLATSVSSLERLYAIIKAYDLANELANAVVYSQDMDFLFRDVYKTHFSKDQVRREGLKKFVKNYLETFPITASIHTPFVEECETSFGSIASSTSKYKNDFPALYRVAATAEWYYRRLLRAYRTIARKEEFWVELFGDLSEVQTEALDSEERLRSSFCSALTQVIMSNQEDLTFDAKVGLETLQLVTSIYTVKSARELVKVSEMERKAKMRPMSETRYAVDDLREAERAFESTLPKPQLLDYREKTTLLAGRFASSRQSRSRR